MDPVNDDVTPERKPHPARRAVMSIAVGVALALLCHSLPVPYAAACMEVSKVAQMFLGGGL